MWAKILFKYYQGHGSKRRNLLLWCFKKGKRWNSNFRKIFLDNKDYSEMVLMQNNLATEILFQVSVVFKSSESWRNNIGSYIYIANTELGGVIIGFKENLEKWNSQVLFKPSASNFLL